MLANGRTGVITAAYKILKLTYDAMMSQNLHTGTFHGMEEVQAEVLKRRPPVNGKHGWRWCTLVNRGPLARSLLGLHDALDCVVVEPLRCAHARVAEHDRT